MTLGKASAGAYEIRCSNKLLTIFLTLLVFLFSAFSATAYSATLVTDQEVYPPGDSAEIYGDGFWAGETVEVQVVHANGDTTCLANHTPWFVVADGSGSFVTSWTVQDFCLDDTLMVISRGETSDDSASALFTTASTKLTLDIDLTSPICIDTLNSSDSVVVCATLYEHCNGGGLAPLPNRPLLFFLNPGNCGVNVGQTPDATVYTDSNGVACFVYYGADTLFIPTGDFSFRVKFLGEDKPGFGDPPNSACNPGTKTKLSNSNKCETFTSIDNCYFNDPPEASCPGDTSIFLCEIAEICIPGFTVSDPDGNIASVTVSGGTLSGDTVCLTPSVGLNTITLIVTDSSGEADTCETNITVTTDTTPPTLVSCPGDITVQCDAVPSPPPGLTGTDNCDPNPVVTYLGETTTPGACPQTYSITRSWEVSDAAGNADTCTQTITVEDTAPPTFVDCPADVTVECDAIPAPATPSATDNCGTVTVNYLGETSAPGACANSYTLTRSWEAVDECGNADTCTQTITVEDTTAPSFVDCPADVTVECDAIPEPVSPTATDNCGTATVTYLGEVSTPGACANSYTLTRSWEAVDECGNADTCTQTITVEDTTAPSLVNCPADVTVQCDSIPEPTNPTATDNCDASPTVTYLGEVVNPGNCPYTITRSWEAVDACGNADTCTQTITVIDTEAPSFVDCPADVTVECDAIPAPASPTATDNCDASPTVTYLGEVSTPGACANSYTLTRSWEATDICGNTDTCYQNIDVVDTTPPSFVDCPADISVECDNIPEPVSPAATDNCGSATVTYLGESSTPGACANSYTLTRAWEAVDECGNSDTCYQNIDVVDTTPPAFVDCPADISVECDNIPEPVSPTATDNCGTATVTYLGESSTPGACVNSYTLTRSWEAVDECGNADTCYQNIDVVDTTAPAFVDCPADSTVDCDNLPTPATPSATDNCDSSPTVNYLGETVNPGSCPYTIVRSWEAIDACGNADTCEQTLTVMDTEAPVIDSCPADTLVSCDEPLPPAANVTASDNCDTDVQISFVEDSVGGNCENNYTLTRTWIATDDCNNADTCIQIIEVSDTTKPITNIPRDTTIYLCDTATVCLTLEATDNCSSFGGAISQIAGPGSFDYMTGMWCYAAMAGTEDITAIFLTGDGCFNEVYDTMNVHFVVNTAPQISVDVAPATLCNAGDSVCLPFNVVDPDNGTTVQTQIGWISGSNICFTADTSGTYCNVLIVTDSCGLSDTASYCIDVTVCPDLDLGADSTKDFGFSCSPISGSFGLRDLSDACGPLMWTVNGSPANQNTTIQYNIGACSDFDQTWEIVVSDNCLRSDTMHVTIRGQVNCPPQAGCPGFLEEIRVCSLGTVVCIPGDEFTCSDQNGNESSSTLNGQPYNPGDSYCFTATTEGPKTLTFICTDECGAADTCTATVDVIVDPNECAYGCTAIRIEKVHNTIQGQYETVEVVIDSMPIGIGGFDLLLEYDASALSLASVEPGSFITDCGWEYFTYRNGASGNCGSSACPSGKLRIIAVAEINNGMNHPQCFQAQPAHIADLIFLVTNDRTFECQYVPIRFCWFDCGDNTVSSVDGELLYISNKVYDYYDGILWTEITDLGASFPSRFGAIASCDIAVGDGKPDPIRCIDFFNGGIDIVCADSIDARGDINLNNIPNEVSDAVLLSNYFVYGLSVFTVNMDGQIAATDVNADGTVLSVADLVYLIRVVVGDAAAYSKVTIPVAARMKQSAEGILTIEDNIQMGAAYIVAAGDVTPSLLVNNMEMAYNYDGTTTRILVWSRTGNSFTGDFIQVESGLTAIEMATSDGNPVMLNTMPHDFILNQNYPNPFNPTTTISFTLPGTSNYELTIYNISGQKVASYVGSAEAAGTVEIQWEAGDFASGIYFYKLVAGEFTEIKKMMLIK